MAIDNEFKRLEVVATLITRGERLLAVFNDKWGSFTLPMTKRRRWADPNMAKGEIDEKWGDAAARAAAEWLGQTSTTPPRFPFEDANRQQGGVGLKIAEYQQSDRDGIWKRYHFRVFRLSLDGDAALSGSGMTEWLTFEQFHDKARRPISETARFLLARVQGEAKLAGKVFP